MRIQLRQTYRSHMQTLGVRVRTYARTCILRPPLLAFVNRIKFHIPRIARYHDKRASKLTLFFVSLSECASLIRPVIKNNLFHHDFGKGERGDRTSYRYAVCNRRILIVNVNVPLRFHGFLHRSGLRRHPCGEPAAERTAETGQVERDGSILIAFIQ